MKKIYEMTSEEIIENLLRVNSNTTLEEKKKKISKEDNDKLLKFANERLLDLYKNISNEDFNMLNHLDETVEEYINILKDTNIYTDEELELCEFVMSFGIYSQINK